MARHDDGLVVLQDRDLDLRTSRDQVRYTLLHPDGRRTTSEVSIRLYTLTELEGTVPHRAQIELDYVLDTLKSVLARAKEKEATDAPEAP